MSEPDERRFSPQLLVDLVLDPRDHGYEDAVRRRGPEHAPKWYERPAVALGCLVIGFVLAVAWVHTHRSAPEAAKVHDRLVQRVRSAQDQAELLARTEAGLTGKLDKLRAAALPASSTLVQGVERSELIAGEVAASGPGLQVRLAEPTVSQQPSGGAGRGDRTPASSGHILTDRDVRSVVNQLWSDGAEAMSVNGIRLTPTSAVRFAGDAVLVDFQPIASPYVIDAVGDSDQLATGFASSEVASRYQTLSSAKGIGFSFHEKDELTLAAGAGTTPRYAHVPKRPR